MAISVLAVSGAAALAGRAILRGDGGDAIPRGRCEVSSTVSVTADPRDRPLSVLRTRDRTWVLTASPAPGGVRVRVVRMPDEGPSDVAFTGEASSAEAVSNLTRFGDGVAFASARASALSAYVLMPHGEALEAPLPAREGRPSGDVSGLALAAYGNALFALVRLPAPHGVRLVRFADGADLGEVTPRERASVRASDAVALGDTLAAAFEREGAVRVALRRPGGEAQVVAVSRDGAPGRDPRVAVIAPLSPATGAAVLTRDERGFVAVRVAPDEGRGFRSWQWMRVLDEPDAAGGDYDLTSARGACGMVVAWRSGGRVLLRGFDLAHGRVGATASVALPPAGNGRVRQLRAERVGERSVVVVETDAGPRLVDVSVADTCAVTARVAPSAATHDELAAVQPDADLATRADALVGDANEGPAVDAARLTLDRVARDGASVWAAGWSASPPSPACAPGAWLSLRAGADGARVTPRVAAPESPWPWAFALVPEAQRACGDALRSIAWGEGTAFAATVTGERAGAQLVVGDVDRGAVRRVALDGRARPPSVARGRDGLVVAWLDGAARAPTLRYRVFSRDGAPLGEAASLGEVTAAPPDARDDGALPLAYDGGWYAAVMRTTHGPRVARIRCGER